MTASGPPDVSMADSQTSPRSHLIASYPFPGSIPHSARPSNLVVNDQSQCAVVASKEFVVVTPHTPTTSKSPHPSLALPPVPSVPLLFDDSISVLPAAPMTHSILPLHTTRTSIQPFSWDGYAPPAKFNWDIDGPSAKRIVEQKLQSAYEVSLRSKSSVDGVTGWVSDGAGGATGGTDCNIFLPPRDVLTRSLCWSPPGLGEETGGCLISVLDNGLNVTIRSAKKDVISGEWAVLGDLSRESYLLSSPGKASPAKQHAKGKGKGKAKAVDGPIDVDAIRGVGKTDLQLEMELQVMCMDWSSSPEFGRPFGTRPGASLLALGNRGGEIALWSTGELRQHPLGTSGMKRLALKQVAKWWITNLAWSEWSLVDELTNVARLALSTSEGSVSWLKVTRRIDPDNEEVELELADKMDDVIEEDGRPVTGLKWVHGALIIAKAGAVHVVNNRDGEVRNQKIMFSKRGNWAGCSGHSPCSGIVPIPSSSVAIALSSGELHIIQTLVTAPQLNGALSNEWTLAFRHALIDANKDRSGPEWSVRLQGFGGLPCPALGGSVVFAAVHEPLPLHDLSIPREASRTYHISFVDFSDLVKTPPKQEDDAMDGIAVDGIRGDSAVISLPSFLPQAYRAKKGLLSSSLDVLPVVQAQRTASQMDLVESDPFEGLQSRAALRSMLQWELVESPLTAVRNSGLIWKGWTSALQVDVPHPLGIPSTEPPSVEPALRTLILWLAQTLLLPSDGTGIQQDVVFISRIISASSLFPDVAAQCQVAQAIQRLRASLQGASGDDGDACLFCNDPLPMSQIDRDKLIHQCANGHVWHRCSITWQLLTTPAVRTCSVCGLKAMLPRVPSLQEDLAVASGDYRTQDALRAASHCTACGNSWIRLA